MLGFDFVLHLSFSDTKTFRNLLCKPCPLGNLNKFFESIEFRKDKSRNKQDINYYEKG